MKKERLFWGTLLILIAIAVILEKLNYFPHINILKIILAIFLLGIVIKSATKINFPGILFPLAFIAILFNKELNISEITPWTVLISALLGSIGLSLIFKKNIVSFSKKDKVLNLNKPLILQGEGNISSNAFFSSDIKYVNTENFQQANIKATFGGIKLYFDKTTLLNGNGIINIDSSFSGIELYVPKSWTVKDNTNLSFSNINSNFKSLENTENTLTLIGNLSFSGVEITYI